MSVQFTWTCYAHLLFFQVSSSLAKIEKAPYLLWWFRLMMKERGKITHFLIMWPVWETFFPQILLHPYTPTQGVRGNRRRRTPSHPGKREDSCLPTALAMAILMRRSTKHQILSSLVSTARFTLACPLSSAERQADTVGKLGQGVAVLRSLPVHFPAVHAATDPELLVLPPNVGRHVAVRWQLFAFEGPAQHLVQVKEGRKET
jgi:hypothetical protein